MVSSVRARPPCPSRVVTLRVPGVSTASWSSSRAKSSRVWPRRRGCPRPGASLSPCSPTHQRGDRRAATMVSGSSAETTAMAKAPRTRAERPATASASEAPPAISSSTRWASTSVSVSEAKVWPAASSSARQLGVVLDDAVVDDGEPPGAVEVGVGVLLRRLTVGGPAGVPDGRRHGRRGACASARAGRPPSGSRRRPGPARGPRRSRGPRRPSRSPGTRGGRRPSSKRSRASCVAGDADDAAHGTQATWGPLQRRCEPSGAASTATAARARQLGHHGVGHGRRPPPRP